MECVGSDYQGIEDDAVGADVTKMLTTWVQKVNDEDIESW